jgi:WD40 repeat protein
VITRDGKRLVSTGYDKRLHVWDLEKRKELHSFEGHTWGIQSVALSPDGQCVVSAGLDGTMRLWRLPRGAQPPE